MGKIKKLILILPLTILMWECPTAWANDVLKVIVSIAPQKYFVKKIGGDLVDVSIMVLPGSSPSTYEPRPQQMVALTNAKIYFAVGVPFEKVWLKKFADVNSKMTIVHTDKGIKKLEMGPHDNHNKTEDKNHRVIKDPHIWLSPPLVMIQSRIICHALMRIDPEHEENYKLNYRAFIREAVELDFEIRDVFEGQGQSGQFMVYHPAWGYFADSYGLKQIPIEIEGKAPTAKELQDYINQAKKKNVRVIFVQPQFSSKSAQTIAKAIGCKIVFADPLAENWSQNLLDVAEKFNSAQR